MRTSVITPPQSCAMIKLSISKAIYLVLISIFFHVNTVSGQTTSKNIVKADESDWKKAMVNTAGTNTMRGIEVFFKRTTCSGTEQVLVKFVNTSSNEILIEWADGIYTSDNEIVRNERNDKPRELILGANEQIEGSCASGTEKSLRFDLSYYLDDPKKTFNYAPSYLDITKRDSHKNNSK